MVLVIRCETSRGQFNFKLPDNATFGDLQSAIHKKYGIAPDAQIISRTRSPNVDFIENVAQNTKLNDINLKHGTRIYLIMVENQVNEYIKKVKIENNQTTMTNNDQNSIDDQKSNNKSKGKKPFKLTQYVPPKKQDKKKTEADIKREEEEKQQNAGPKHQSFHEYIKERQRKYAKTQPWAIDPPKYDYNPVKMGRQVNFSDLPPNAVVMRQPYRHVDVATFYDSSPYTKFKANWEKNSSIQRCAYLIGRYEMIPNTLTKKKKKTTSTQIEEKNSELMCAKIYALYEPPQKGTGRGVTLMKDKNEEKVDAVIRACGMQKIGIVFTTLPRGGKKYNGDVFMSGKEIFTSARLQEKFKNKNTGFSKFITLICHVGMKEAQCFMISDQGVALCKGGVINAGDSSLTDEAKDNYGFMKVNIPPPKIYFVGVINENKEIRQGDHFAPDALLVNIIATVAKKQEHIFNYVHFPSPQDATIDHVRKHLIHHKDKELHVALSDFNLLVYLTNVIDIGLVIKVADHVVRKDRMNEDLVKKVKGQLRIAVPGY